MADITYSIASGDNPRRISSEVFIALLTIPEVCEWLNIGESTLHKLWEDLKLVPVPIEGRVLYDPEDVRAYIASQKALAKITCGKRRPKAEKATVVHP